MLCAVCAWLCAVSAHGVGKAILSGGRYDTLMAYYGYPCSAIGFAFDMENLVNAIEKRG